MMCPMMIIIAALIQIGYKYTKDLHLVADTEEQMWNWLNSVTQAAAVPPPPPRYLPSTPSLGIFLAKTQPTGPYFAMVI